MVIHGRVQNGTIVLDGGFILPEGAEVIVSCGAALSGTAEQQKRRVTLPLVDSDRPGTLDLTAERIAELLDQDDVPA